MTSKLPIHQPFDAAERIVGAFLALLASDFDDRTKVIDAALIERAQTLVAGAVLDLDEVLSPGDE